MKYIITESQLNNYLNKESLIPGKYGDMIEKMIFNYIGPEKICDIAVTCSQHDENYYLAVVLLNNYAPYNLSGKLSKFIKTFIPIDLFLNIDERTCNPHNLT
jgi:hypothetical protein